MKFISSILLISAAIATVATAAPLAARVSTNTNNGISNISKRCAECTHEDGAALDLVVIACAKHYADIAHARLDSLMRDIEAAEVTSGAEALPREKAVLTITVKSKIEKAKQDCTSEALAPVIKAIIAADASLDIPWSRREEVEKKMGDLGAKITAAVLTRIQPSVNAEVLSKDCTEKMTNTEIAPAPAPEVSARTPETPASAAETPAPAPETLAPIPESPAPAPETPAPTPQSTAVPSVKDIRYIASDIDPKFVCKFGCQDTQDANAVMSLHMNLKNEFVPRLARFYNTEVPTDCAEKRGELLGGVLISLNSLRIDVGASANAYINA